MSNPNPATTQPSPQPTYRSLPILISYLIFAAALALNALRAIAVRYKSRTTHNDWSSPRRHAHFALFACLAALSLAATWYYMFAFFAHSYRDWEGSRGALDAVYYKDSVVARLELWLQNTKLFHQAWETVIETPARFWWSGQIFLWTTGWSVFLGVMARRYRIPRAWAYMLLGQIVAISFALNLFFATILVSRQPLSQRRKEKRRDGDTDDEDARALAWLPPRYCELVPVATSLLSTVLVPSVAHTKYFMATLLVPHLLLFVPAMLRPSRSAQKSEAKAISQADEDRVTRQYVVFFQGFVVVCVALQAHATYLALQAMGPEITYAALARNLVNAITEHPAAGSVSWDVIFCTISGLAWAFVNGGSAERMLGRQ